nr:ubiquitin carboxyl terminal hydrolase 4 [Hymenolepis microstoma]
MPKFDLFSNEIDGKRLSDNQLKIIESAFSRIRCNESYITLGTLMNILGRYPPEYVIERFLLQHGKSVDVINLVELQQLMRFLLNGTTQDRLRALYNYYMTSQGILTKETLESIIKEEGGNFKSVEGLSKNIAQYEFDKFFSKNPDATPMSSWIFHRTFKLVDEVLKKPSKSYIFSISTGRLFRFLDDNDDGVIDIREFFQRLYTLHQTSDNDFANVVYQMYLRDSGSGNRKFNIDGFVICLTQFVPKRIIQQTTSKMEELNTCTSSSRFSSWSSDNPSFRYFVKFIRTTIHVVFGLPPSHKEETLVEILMLWLQFVINQGPKLGSQWYLFSSKYWSPMIIQDNFQDLKILELHSKYCANHPVSMFDEIFTAAPPRSKPLETGERKIRGRIRGISENMMDESTRKNAKKNLKIGHWILEGLARRQESKTEREHSKSMNQRFQKSVVPNVSSTFVSRVGSTSPPRREAGVSTRTPNKDWITEDGPFIAVDRRLAQRMQQWKQGNVGKVFVSSESLPMPSYLIGYVLNSRGTSEEILEIQSLEIRIRAATGVKIKYLPNEGLITNIEPPKNKHLRENLSMGAKQINQKKRYVSGSETNSPDVGSPRLKSPTSTNSTVGLRKRSASSLGLLTDTAVSSSLDYVEISTQKLAAKSLRFAFSRCHTLSEVFKTICKYYVDYRGRDLNSDNARMWLAISPVFSEIPTRSRTSTTTKMGTSVGNGSFSGYTTDATNESVGGCSSKRLALIPIDLKIVGDQNLARYLADQETLSHWVKQLLNPEARCSRIFDFVIECRNQFLFWTFNQPPTKAFPFTGLKNLGNTCYLNSVIQCLMVTPELTKGIKNYVTPITKLAREYIRLLDQMQTSDEPLNPQSLLHVFLQKWSSFNSDAQQDAQEFLTIFLDSLNEELKRKPHPEGNELSKSYDSHVSSKHHELISPSMAWDTFCSDNASPIVKVFYGLCESICKFDGCSHSSSVFDPFSNLTLPLPFNTIESFTLTVVPEFGAVPEVIQIERDKIIDFDFIRGEIARRYCCSENQIFFVRLISGSFKPILSTSKYQDSIHKIKEQLDNKVWAFILPEHHSEHAVDKEHTIIIQNRISVPSNTAILEETAYTTELVGGPTVIQVPTNATNKELYNVVEKAIRRFVTSSQDSKQHSSCSKTAAFFQGSNYDGLEKCTRKCTAFSFDKYDTAEYFFSIKQSDRRWFKCSRCPWSKMCRGCQVPVNSTKVDFIRSEDTCVYLAVDWNLAAYVNEYQQAQENRKKIVDQVESPEDLRKKNICQLDHLLQCYFETENKSKDECITCERCNKRQCFSKSTAICVLPDVLLITLKRFQATKCGWRKLTTMTDFPLSALDMRPYLSKEVNIRETIYDLYAVVNHIGTLNEGHYYAHIKRESDGHWFRVNDIECSELPRQSVVTPDAYVLFYRRRKS